MSAVKWWIETNVVSPMAAFGRLQWYLNTHIQLLKPTSQYRHWLTTRQVIMALDKWHQWQHALIGPWQLPGV